MYTNKNTTETIHWLALFFQNHFFLFAIMTCTTAVNFFFCRSKLWKTKNTFCYFDLEDGETGTLRKNFWRHDVPALYPYSRTNDASTNGTDLYINLCVCACMRVCVRACDCRKFVVFPTDIDVYGANGW